jgi:hypothetical protein
MSPDPAPSPPGRRYVVIGFKHSVSVALQATFFES